MITNEQLIEKFNPENAGNLSAEDLEILRSLTDEQIDVLANKFPNQPTRKSYLRLYDKTIPLEKQLYQLSTWQNLRNVRKFSSRKNLIPWDFLTKATRFNQPRPTATTNKITQSPRKVVVDLSAQEAANELRQNIVDKSVEKPADVAGAAPVVTVSKTTSTPRKLTAKQQKAQDDAAAKTGDLPPDQQLADVQ